MEAVGPLGRRRPKETEGPLPTERAVLPARLRPTAFAGPLGHPRGTERVRQRAGRSATEPAGHQVGPRQMGPAGHPDVRSVLGLAEPARTPAASAAMRLAGWRRARAGRAPASIEGQGRGRDPARAESGDQPPVPSAGLGTGTGTTLRRVRRADGAPTGPLNAPVPADPAPPGLTRTDPAPPGLTRTDPAPPGLTRTDPAPRDPVRITRRGAVPGFRRPRAAARRTGPGKSGPERVSHVRARRGRACPASRTRSPLSNSPPSRAPNCTACRTT